MVPPGQVARRYPTHTRALLGRAARDRDRPILFEPKDDAAADCVRFDEPDRHFVSDPEDPTGSPPDQSLRSLVAIIIVAGQGRYRDKPIGSILCRGDEKPEGGYAADAAGENAADRSGKDNRTVALERGAFGGRGPAFGRRDMFRYGRQLLTIRVGRRSARARVALVGVGAGSQRSMDHKIGIAPDRRREMAIAAQSQPELTNIIGAVGGLCLAAEDQFVDDGRRRCRRCTPQDPVKQLWLQRLPFCEAETGDADLVEDYTQLLQLFRVGRVMNTVHARSPLRLEFLCSGDVRQDHKLLDQPMAVEPDRAGYRDRLLFGVEHDLNLVDVELQGAAVRPRRGKRSERAEERPQSFLRRR